MREYYARRAAEYDATSWDVLDTVEREAVKAFILALAPRRVLDIGCGTGYLTCLLHGSVVAVDQSEQMLAIARQRAPHAQFVHADVPPLPFEDDAFELTFSSGFYSHLETAEERAAFVAEALRVAPELIVLDQARRDGRPPESREQRRLRDGSEYEVFKRYFTTEELTTELDGVTVFTSTGLVAVRTSRSSAPRD